MAIRYFRMGLDLTKLQGGAYAVIAPSANLAACDTADEAEQAREALMHAGAPRFTRNEAIALVREAYARGTSVAEPIETLDAVMRGIRLALEALAAAGVFVDGRNMADRLDAAGIR